MVTVRVAVPVPPALVALKVKVVVPGSLGVPEIKPLNVLRDKPTGNVSAP